MMRSTSISRRRTSACACDGQRRARRRRRGCDVLLRESRRFPPTSCTRSTCRRSTLETGPCCPPVRDAPKPVGVSIDILDEDHSLKLAMRRLATDPQLRGMLGQNARALWKARFMLERMASGYRDAIGLAVASPMPASSRRAQLPHHLLADGTEHTERLLRKAGLPAAPKSYLRSGQLE